MNKQLHLEIGEQVFHVYFMKRTHRLLNGIRRHWHEYIADSMKDGCRVGIIPYSQGRTFLWDLFELDRFRKYFLMIHRRFPSEGQIEKTIEDSIRLLQHLDPNEESMRHIRSRIDKLQTLIYARVGLDLFFFDTELNNAFFFIQKRTRLFTIVAWLMNGLTGKQPDLMCGFTNGMMFVLSHLLIHNRGLLVHGAAIQKEDLGVLFLGLSGAGKSTITHLCRPDVCFSDDGVIIRKEGDNVFAYWSPFRQIRHPNKNSGPIKGKVDKIFLLEKGRKHMAMPMRKNELMNTILMNLIHFFKYFNNETACTGFYLIKEILDALPAYKLEFAQRGEVWDNISNAKGGA